jgi:hypothetical protein
LHDINKKNGNKRGQRKNRQNPGKPSNQRRDLIELRRFTQPRDQVMKFVRTSTDVFSIQPNSGLNASGNFDFGYTFSLSQTIRYIAGTASSVISNPGSGDFTALYDQWRIDAVELAFMFGANSVSAGALATAQLPIINMVFDPTDSSTISLSSILQYQELHTVQLGNQQNTSNGYTIRMVPTARLLDGTTTTYAVADPIKWVSIDSPAVEHFGIKCFYDNAGSTLTTVIGSVTVYVKYFLSMKRSK